MIKQKIFLLKTRSSLICLIPEPDAADGWLKIATDDIDFFDRVVEVFVVGLFLFVIIFDSSFLGTLAAPFDADDADLATDKLSVFLRSNLG